MKANGCFPLLSIAAALFVLLSLPPGTVAKESCITAQCHAAMGREKYIHGPVALGECMYCHQPTASHSFKPINNVGKLCSSCHDKELTGKVVHPQVKEGRCGQCHDPHQSPNPFLLFSP